MAQNLTIVRNTPNLAVVMNTSTCSIEVYSAPQAQWNDQLAPHITAKYLAHFHRFFYIIYFIYPQAFNKPCKVLIKLPQSHLPSSAIFRTFQFRKVFFILRGLMPNGNKLRSFRSIWMRSLKSHVFFFNFLELHFHFLLVWFQTFLCMVKLKSLRYRAARQLAL